MTKIAPAVIHNTQDAVLEALQQTVSETVVATMLAQNFHWNVTGMHFGALHALFQEIYEDHFAAQDELAERMRALGGFVDGQLASMLVASKVSEHAGRVEDVEMIKAMMSAQETLAQTLKGASEIAADQGDGLTEDLCIARAQVHEKFAWMMRAHLR
jgi:starvation-inducible DNA-binding protein